MGFPLLQTDEFSSVASLKAFRVSNQRGRVLGGSPAINLGFYSRASDEFVQERGGIKSWWRGLELFMDPDELTKFQFDVKLGSLEAGVLHYIGFPGNINREERSEGFCLVSRQTFLFFFFQVIRKYLEFFRQFFKNIDFICEDPSLANFSIFFRK